VVIIIVLVMLIFSVGRIVSLMMQMNQMEKELDELNAEKKELEEQVGQIGTDAYTEKQAREWLKMAKQGELIYTTDGDEAAETADQNDTKQDE
jgi:cell division protein FtsB